MLNNTICFIATCIFRHLFKILKGLIIAKLKGASTSGKKGNKMSKGDQENSNDLLFLLLLLLFKFKKNRGRAGLLVNYISGRNRNI